MATVGVLLPVRIETRFDGMRLRLRLIPDEPWFDRHDPLPSTAELNGLERYLTAAGDQPTSPAGRAAWDAFARQHGPGRAAWMLRSFPPASVDPDGRRRVVRPPVVREEPRFTELAGLPERLEIWLARGGGPAVLAATWTLDHARLRLDPPDPDLPGDRRWWDSWDEAVLVGLAGVIDLGTRADDIDVLYVVGLGSAPPDVLFAAHREAGQLGLLTYGTPTNTVNGTPAADLGGDPASWPTLLERAATDTERTVSLALTGDENRLGPLPGNPTPQADWTQLLVAGLWPALWGHTFEDVLGLGPPAHELAEWATQHLFPAGPYPAVRVGGQPYGLLPATSLTDWQTAAGDPPAQAGLPKALAEVRARWAAAARATSRTVVGADAGQLLDIIAQPPASPAYATRLMDPLELWLLALQATGHPITWPELIDAWDQRYPLTATLGLAPQRRYGAVSAARRVPLPLVVPPRLPSGQTVEQVLHALVRVAQKWPDQFINLRNLVQEFLAGGSLLLVLAARALQLAIAAVGRAALGVPEPALEPVAADPADPTRLAEHILAATPADLASSTLEALAFRRVAAALDAAAAVPVPELERLLPATIDCASHRVDAWSTGLAYGRLKEILAAGPVHPPREGPRLGAFGWVDRPRPGRPGPTAGGLLHAPSAPQAVTAALLRDRAVRDPEPGRWHLDVTSATARRAAALAAEVTFGIHPAEALGREVERIVGDPAKIGKLRERFPIRTEHAGRRVCDGQQVLDADPMTLGLGQGDLDALKLLRGTVNVYGDLLVAEAVHNIVQGRPEAAGAAMDAAAGLARPPTLEVLRTQREGRSAATTCVIVLADAAAPALPADPNPLAEVSPARLADAAAAQLVLDRVGTPADWTWTAAPAGGPQVTVTLADLDLAPAEALALTLGDLESLVAATAGTTNGAAGLIGRDGSHRYNAAVRLVTLLGQSPASPVDLEETVHAGHHPAVAVELRERYLALRAVAAALADRLAAASTGGQLAAALRIATRWGIAPEPTAGSQDSLPRQARRARELLQERLAATPAAATVATLDHLELARAIARLASATGQIAILSRIRRDSLPALVAAGPPSYALDAAWLRIIAAVRPPLARLEAAQLTSGTPSGAGDPLTAWSNRPADPWQTDTTDSRRLIVAYAPADIDLEVVSPETTVAAALLDRFAETVPAQAHTTTAAFGFDAPGARAPQAILLAVPPDLSRPLDTSTVLRIVAETRELAHARAAVPADLAAADGFAPLPLLPATGNTATPVAPI